MSGGTLTARIAEGPSELIAEEVLLPQLRHEAARLLPHYVRAERVLVAEYLRMGLIDDAAATRLTATLGEVTEEAVLADPDAAMADTAFAIEQFVGERLGPDLPAVWHADRSRNDLQACAQLMHGRDRVLDAVAALLRCAATIPYQARRYADTPMPGYTHLQAAQVMTPGFYLAGLADHLIRTARRFLTAHDDMARCPLGAGAMTGQELDWDRPRMATLLGFAAPHPHPLTAVASRSWLLDLTAEGSAFGVTLTRFATDLMAWGGSAYGFLELPDALAGISSAMPQKKNYPVLERIRGRAAHLTAHHVDVAMTQRATAFGNSVEVSKEGCGAMTRLFDDLGSVLRLLALVLDHLSFDEAATRAACEGEFLGGFSLANRLTVGAGIPWRTAQVIAGEYIMAVRRLGLPPANTRPDLLADAIRARHGEPPGEPRLAAMLGEAFDLDQGLFGRQRSGSAHPAAVRQLIVEQEAEIARLNAALDKRRRRLADADQDLTAALRGES